MKQVSLSNKYNPDCLPEAYFAHLLIAKIKRTLTFELLRPEHRKQRSNEHPLAGHCYVASEALFHMMGGKDIGLKPMCSRMGNATHWWLDWNGLPFDPTAEQFEREELMQFYAQGKGKGFLTSYPSLRAKIVIGRVEQLED